MTWNEYYQQVRTVSRAFIALGLEEKKGVSILQQLSTVVYQ
ncbi:MAG: hypothetical protein R2874_07660 [Desulfobacterales bacterium]